MSQVAGVELVPSIDFEIANINISVSDGLQENIITEPRDGEKDRPLGDGISSVAWHYDSFPFVCVVMLSDCTGMLGGETALRTASGEILKVRGPAMVNSYSPNHFASSARSSSSSFPAGGVDNSFRGLPLSCRVGTSSIRH